MADERFLTREQIAERLQVSPRTVDNLRANGMPSMELPGSRLVRFDADAVSEWMRQQTTGAAANA